MNDNQKSLFPEDKKPDRYSKLNATIEKLVKRAVEEKYPEGEPEPKLYSEGYRDALEGYAKYQAAIRVRRVLSGVFPETK